MADLYDILGVPRGIAAGGIRAAYLRLAKEHHPDKGGDTDRFKEIEEAYRVLSDAEERAHYDRTGTIHPGFANENAKVYAVVANIMAAILAKAETPTASDIVAAMRDEIVQDEKKSFEGRCRAEGNVKKLTRVVDRFETDKPENIMQAMVRQHITDAQKEIADIDEYLDLLRRARLFLKDYRYRSDKLLEFSTPNFDNAVRDFGKSYSNGLGSIFGYDSKRQKR